MRGDSEIPMPINQVVEYMTDYFNANLVHQELGEDYIHYPNATCPCDPELPSEY
jgi:hypothetical protein